MECEGKKALLDIYQNEYNKFYPYGERLSKKRGKAQTHTSIEIFLIVGGGFTCRKIVLIMSLL